MKELTATEMNDAMKLRERDFRARRLADTCVAMAMQELNADAPEDYGSREFAHRVASLATAFLVSGIYSGDEELRALKAERDQLRTLYEEAVRTMPITHRIQVEAQ